MQTITRFWKKDRVNKVILLVAVLIVVAVGIDLLILLVPKPDGNALVDDLFPTPTLQLSVLLTQNAATAEYRSAMATASVPPTMTTMPLTPVQKATQPFQIYTTPTQSNFQPAATVTLAPPTSTPTTPTRTPFAATPSASKTLSSPQTPLAPGAACIPSGTPQTGKVVDVIDGNTVKVLINGLVYVVRYIGVKPPTDETYAQWTAAKNGELVFLKQVSLAADGADKDSAGRLLRYVSVGNTFVNLELIQNGLASADQAAPPLSCTQALQDAEKASQAALAGIWGIAPAALAP